MSVATELNVVKIRGFAEMGAREGIFTMCAVDLRARCRRCSIRRIRNPSVSSKW